MRQNLRDIQLDKAAKESRRMCHFDKTPYSFSFCSSIFISLNLASAARYYFSFAIRSCTPLTVALVGRSCFSFQLGIAICKSIISDSILSSSA